MPSPKTLLLLVLGGFVVFYALVSWAGLMRDRRAGSVAPTPSLLGVGFVTNFFDTLGIGSYATTTSLYKLLRLVNDRIIPGTLNVGHTPPTFAQAFIFIAIVDVDMTTLVALIGASVLGAWLGAGVVSRWPAQKVRIGMGAALLAAAGVMAQRQVFGDPAEVGADGLAGGHLLLGAAGNFVLGSLMSLGIGLYAPCMILVSLLGMNPKLAFPIMMGSCAFLMPVASVRFVRAGSYDPRAALGLAIAGVPAVLLAAYLVRSLPLAYVRWLVVGVVVYTATAMLRSAWTEGRTIAAEPSPQAS